MPTCESCIKDGYDASCISELHEFDDYKVNAKRKECLGEDYSSVFDMLIMMVLSTG